MSKRLLVSIGLSSAITKLLSGLDPSLTGVQWLAPEQMHLTLSFLGNVSSQSEEILKSKLTGFDWKPFFLPIWGLGRFPSKGPPAVLWIGVGKGHPHLFQLHKRVQEAAIGAGIEVELRAFHPHVTMARCRNVSWDSVQPFFKKHTGFDAGMVHVKSFSLNSSKLTPGGSIYTCELFVPCG